MNFPKSRVIGNFPGTAPIKAGLFRSLLACLWRISKLT
jgi:hypothetical protein